jgi:hypothetical protein
MIVLAPSLALCIPAAVPPVPPPITNTSQCEIRDGFPIENAPVETTNVNTKKRYFQLFNRLSFDPHYTLISYK